MKLMVMAISEPGGKVSIRICRRNSDNPEADAAPLELTYGTLDVELDHHEMSELHSALTDALWFRTQ